VGSPRCGQASILCEEGLAAVQRDAMMMRIRVNLSASVVRQTVDNLSSLVRARLTFSKMSDAFAVQINGFGFSLC